MDELFQLRKHIDALDEKLFRIMAERISVVRKIGKLKKKSNLPLLDIKRRDEIVTSILLNAKSLGLSESFAKKLFHLIHEYSLEIENEK